MSDTIKVDICSDIACPFCYVPDVEADIQQAQSYGIRGAPFFVIDGRYALSGAQDPAAFAQTLIQAREEKAAAS